MSPESDIPAARKCYATIMW